MNEVYKYRIVLLAEDREYVLKDEFHQDYRAAKWADEYRAKCGLDEGQEIYIEEYLDEYYH